MNNNIPTVTLDADHAGTLLVVMSELHTYWMEMYRKDTVDVEGLLEKMYLLGNIEGRCIHNGLTQKDLDILEAWEEDMVKFKEENGGCLIPIDDAFKNAMEEFHGEE